MLARIVCTMVVVLAPGHLLTAKDGCTILDERNPLIAVSYDPLTEPGSNWRNGPTLRLRLSNNSSCSIVVITYEPLPPTDLSEFIRDPESNYQCDTSRLLELKDGAEVAMGYSVNFYQGNRTIAHGENDTPTSGLLKGGRSVVFTVPTSRLKRANELRVDFQYEWEVCTTAQNQYVNLRRYVRFFLFEKLARWRSQ